MGDLIKTVLPIAVSFLPLPFPVGLILNFAIGQITSKIGQEKGGGGTFATESQDRRHIVRSAIAPHRVIYGEVSVSGHLTYAGTSGSGDQFMHMVITLAGHECEAIGDIYLNDELLPDLDGNGFPVSGDYKDYVRIKKHLGGSSQVADPDLVSEVSQWKAEAIGVGICYLYVRLEYDRDDDKGGEIFPTGIPTFRATVQGKNDILDPRDSTTGYTNNAALCQLDYFRGAHGLDATDTEWDSTYAQTAANECDESVSKPGSGTQSRYVLNGTFLRSQRPIDVIKSLNGASGGSFIPHQGVFRQFAIAAGTVTRAALTESDFTSSLSVKARPSRDELFNAVKGTYVAADKFWQETDFPELLSSAAETEDGGERIYRDLHFPFVTDPYQAQRLAMIELKKHRNGLTFSARLKPHAWDITTNDLVEVTIDALSWSAKQFRVTDLSIGLREGVIATFQEDSDTAYDDDIASLSEIVAAPNSNFGRIDQFGSPTALTLLSGDAQLLTQGDGSQIASILVSWTRAPSIFVRSHQVQYKPTASSTWLVAGDPGAVDSVRITPVSEGVDYDVRVRSVSSFGKRSDWTQVSPHTVIGKLESPPDVASMTIDGNVVTWPAVVANDLVGYELRYNTGTKVDFGLGILLREADLAREFTLPDSFSAGTNAIMVSAKDSSGNYSATPAYVITNLGDALVANVVETQDEHADGFTGTKTDCTVSSGDLDADSEATPLMWNANDTALMWDADDTTLMWIAVGYKAMVYQWEVNVAAPLAGSTLTLSHTIVGDNQTIEYGRSGGELMWATDDTTAMWDADDTTAMWGRRHSVRAVAWLGRDSGRRLRVQDYDRGGRHPRRDHRAERGRGCAGSKSDVRRSRDLGRQHQADLDGRGLDIDPERAAHRARRRRRGRIRQSNRQIGHAWAAYSMLERQRHRRGRHFRRENPGVLTNDLRYHHRLTLPAQRFRRANSKRRWPRCEPLSPICSGPTAPISR